MLAILLTILLVVEKAVGTKTRIFNCVVRTPTLPITQTGSSYPSTLRPKTFEIPNCLSSFPEKSPIPHPHSVTQTSAKRSEDQ